ncbi:REP-associated tyrosine transposase [Pseudomonas helleri]|jgi:putative transposase|uniref:Transposase n=1 Tax=Pseudomonas helleri TaxID=1608996 RepID=A0A6L5HSD7_9PSED|nr:transposase [Pseudomonas helleri]MQU06183.1 transposase [Pseudomonas helleri]
MPTQASNCRLRKGRFSQPGQIYVLTSVVKQRRVVFKDWHIGRLLVNQFREAENAGLVASLAWVVMPDHFHWLIQLQQGSLAELMCQVKSRSSKAINGQGAIWQRGYHDRAVRREEDLKMIARYIVMNPIRAGLVQKVGDYPLWDAIWI